MTMTAMTTAPMIIGILLLAAGASLRCALGPLPCAPAINSAVVGGGLPLLGAGAPSTFSGGGENFSPGAQKRNFTWPSSTVSPGFTGATTYSSPFTFTPLADLLS